MTSLKRSRSMSSSAARRPCLRARASARGALPAEQRAVGQPGQRVVQRLAAQAARGAGRRCAGGWRTGGRGRGPARPRRASVSLLMASGHRGVGQVGLERALDGGVRPRGAAGRRPRAASRPSPTSVAAVLDLGVGGAAEGAQQAGRRARGAVEAHLAVVGPDGLAVTRCRAQAWTRPRVLAGGLPEDDVELAAAAPWLIGPSRSPGLSWGQTPTRRHGGDGALGVAQRPVLDACRASRRRARRRWRTTRMPLRTTKRPRNVSRGTGVPMPCPCRQSRPRP